METLKLSPLDQIMPRCYSRVILCFAVDPSTPHSTIIVNLERGWKSCISAYPSLAGSIQLTEDNGAQKGRLEVKYAQDGTGSKLGVHDLQSFPRTYSELARDNVPMIFLDGDTLSSPNVYPDPSSPAPVFDVQANFIHGGLLLLISIHHAVADGTGLGNIISIMARASHTLPEDIPSAQDQDTDHRNLLSHGLSRDQAPKNHLEYSLVPPSPVPTTIKPLSPPAPPPSMTSHIFYFPPAALASLKLAASSPSPSPPTSDGWISTYDALSALLWSRISRARLPHLNQGSTSTSMLGMAVNGRHRLSPPLPPSYIGNVNLYARTTASLGALTSLTSSTLPTLAHAVRRATGAIDNAHIRSLISYCDSLADMRALMPAFATFLGHDLAITAWTDLPLYEADFGNGLGKPEWVRVPKASFDGLCIILPKRGDGGIEVLVGLRSDDMARLKGDEAWREYAQERCE